MKFGILKQIFILKDIQCLIFLELLRLALNKYVTLYYSKDVRLPVQLQRAMAAEAEAAREARAKVIAAEGEQKASHALKEAAKVIQESPSALQVCIVISILYQNPAFVLSILITRSLQCIQFMQCSINPTTFPTEFRLHLETFRSHLQNSDRRSS